MPGPGRERGRDLHCRRTGADHADPSTVERHRVIPSRAVERGTRERIETLDVRDVRVVQHPRGRDHHIHDVVRAGRRLQVPTAVDELAPVDALAESHAVDHPVVPRHPFEVRVDLRTGRERVAPLGVGRERIRVEVRRHVARDTGIGVVPPRTADPVALLVDHDVVEPGLGQLDGGQDAGHPGADHGKSQRSSVLRIDHGGTLCGAPDLSQNGGTVAIPRSSRMATTFTRMDESTAEQWAVIGAETMKNQPRVADEVLSMLTRLEGITDGFATNQLVHSLQTATLAEQAGADEQMIVASLCHDIGKLISVFGHPGIAAAILRPYVRDDVFQVILVHQDFQGRHYYQHFGQDPNLRDQHRDQPWYPLAEQFADEWDQVAFDPDAHYESLDHFEPMVREVFARPVN